MKTRLLRGVHGGGQVFSRGEGTCSEALLRPEEFADQKGEGQRLGVRLRCPVRTQASLIADSTHEKRGFVDLRSDKKLRLILEGLLPAECNNLADACRRYVEFEDEKLLLNRPRPSRQLPRNFQPH